MLNSEPRLIALEAMASNLLPMALHAQLGFRWLDVGSPRR